MAKHSNLGPIDPQFGPYPAHGVIQEFRRAYSEIKRDPTKMHVWQHSKHIHFEDLKKIGLEVSLNQIVPIGASAMMSSKIVKDAILKVYPGAPHGMCSTLKDQVNAELLAFIQ